MDELKKGNSSDINAVHAAMVKDCDELELSWGLEINKKGWSKGRVTDD